MKPRSNGSLVNGQDIMMNLLGESSESDPELLKLPPLKGKKATKRKKHYSTTDGFSLCNLWTLVKAFLVVLLVCTVSVLGFITVWLSGQLKELKIQLEDVQSKNFNSASSVSDLVSQIQDINKTIHNIKTGEHGLDQMWSSMATMSKQIASLNESTKAIQDSINLKTATNLKQLTSQIPVISSSVADLGVGVKSLKSTVQELSEFKKKVEGQLQDILNSGSKGGKELPDNDQLPEGGSSMNPDFVNEISKKFEQLSDAMTQGNVSVWNRLNALQIDVDSYQGRFMTLENSTAYLQKHLDELTKDNKPSGDNVPSSDDKAGNTDNEQIKAIVHKMVQDMGLLDDQTKDSDILESLQENIDNITSIMTRLKEEFSQWKEESKDDNPGENESPDDLLLKIQILNKTVQHLNSDFGTLKEKLIQQQNQLVNVSHTVSTMQQFVSALEKEHTEIIGGIITNATKAKNTPHVLEATTTGPKPTTPKAEENEPPTASTAGLLTVVMPVDKLILDGSNSTDDKGIVRYAWEQIRGPNKVDITDADKPVATATGDFREGKYIFAIQVFDEERLSSEMKLIYTIQAPSTSEPNVETNPTSAQETTTSPIVAGSSTLNPELHPYINISVVKTYADLEVGVRRWDHDGDGFVTADDLVGFMPNPPSAADLEPFDFNHDGKYDLDELAVALGFKPWIKDEDAANEINKENE